MRKTLHGMREATRISSWDAAQNWSGDVSEPVATSDVIFPTPIPNPGSLASPGTIVLTAGEVAKSITFNANYRLTGGTLALSTPGNVTLGRERWRRSIRSLRRRENLFVTAPPPTSTAVSSLLLGGNNTFSGTINVESNAQLRALEGTGVDGLVQRRLRSLAERWGSRRSLPQRARRPVLKAVITSAPRQTPPRQLPTVLSAATILV